MDCAGSCVKFLLIFFNFIFWLSGVAIMGVGIWMLADKNIGSYFEVLHADSSDVMFKYAAYILIAFGVFVLLVGFCGCCGAIRNSTCLLTLYIFFLILVFAGELAVGIMMAINQNEISDKVDKTLAKSIKEKYSASLSITDAWDIVQIQLDCCGGKGPEDYVNSTFSRNSGKLLPVSCCILTNKAEAEEDPKKAAPINATNCQNMRRDYNTQGCHDGLLAWAKKHIGILIGIGFGIGCLQIFGVAIACWLCCRIRREDKY